MYSFNLIIKRIFDIFSSAIVIIILAPFWIAIPIAIKKDSKGPVFFKQKRRTKNGKVFQILKFRSMIVNAEKRERDYLTMKMIQELQKLDENCVTQALMNYLNFLILLKGI